MIKEWKNKIYYSQCWEDPYVLLEGLDIQKEDKIISITSGGCNTLALLLEDPREIVAIDINPAQNYLFELKILAIKHLSYKDLLAFLGINPCRDRFTLFLLLEPHLNKESNLWWKENVHLIKRGIIHAGKLERYFRLFSKYILPLVHKREVVQRLFIKKTFKEQHDFYDDVWNTLRWRLLFITYFGKRATSIGARNKKLFRYVSTKKISTHYINNIKTCICANPSRNFFLHYIFTGKYSQKNLPLYLREENIQLIRDRLDRIKMVSDDLATFIKVNEGRYNKYNLSNIFETLSVEKTSEIFADIIKYTGKNTRLVYINHLVDRTFPDSLSYRITPDVRMEQLVNEKNMAFFYKKIHIDYIK